MKVQSSRLIAGDIETVFARYVDYASWPEWLGKCEVTIQQPGTPTNGAGCVRVIKASGLTFVEEVVTFEPPRLMGYRMHSGLPMQERAEVLFESAPGGTLVTWRAEFEPNNFFLALPLRAVLFYIFSSGLAGLAKDFQGFRVTD